MLSRIVGNVAVLILLGFAAFTIFASFCVDNAGSSNTSFAGYCVFAAQENFQSMLGIDFISASSLAISFFNFVLPIVFESIATYENYANPTSAENMTLARSFLLKMSSIYMIFIDFYLNERYKAEVGIY
jgi:hypothetical protein